MNQESRIKNNAGFSLIELMVTITIFILITSITMANYPKFSNKLSLDLLTQDIALSVRQAQIYGSSVVGAKISGGPIFRAYGVHLEAPDPTLDVDPSGQYLYTYLLFADIGTPVGQYHGPSASAENECVTPSPTNGCLQKFLISGVNEVKLLCVNFEQLGDTTQATVDDKVLACGKDPNNQLSSLDITFNRPNLNANFFATLKDKPDVPYVSPISNVGIVLQSPAGDYTKIIVVWKTGQISVE